MKDVYPLKVEDAAVAKIKGMMLKDEKSAVRARAISFLSSVRPELLNEATLEQLVNDPSYMVAAKAIEILGNVDSEKATSLAKSLETDAEGGLLMGIATLYSQSGTKENLTFMKSAINRVTGFNDKYVMVQLFGKYVMQQDDETQAECLETLKSIAIENSAWYIRMSAIQVIAEMTFAHRENETISAKLTDIMNEVKEKETDPKVRGLLGE